ncbi:MAG: DUF1223 domain-containing protein [Acidobacteria bacterium]|nr:DUF1223 domain-containing protein [Acidobacteriota bacterium]
MRLLAAAVLLTVSTSLDAAPPVLVELFTSQGCSSCPPADRVLLGLRERAIVLSMHVDYWNRLGWRDPYSQAVFSERQQAYARSAGTTRIYTPQMIVDGVEEFVGSDEGRVRRSVEAAARVQKGTLTLVVTGGPEVEVRVSVKDLPAIAVGDAAEVLVALAEDGLGNEVPRGENSGRRLVHTGVVRVLARAGEIAGGTRAFEKTVSLPVDPAFARKNLRIVAFVQARSTRRVLAVAERPLP